MRINALGMFAAASALASLTAGGAEAKALRVLHAFLDGCDGATSNAPVIPDQNGNLFGTALQGGASNNGVVFEVAADGTESVLYSFAGGGGDGRRPESGLISDGACNFYGTTRNGGGHGCGTYGCGTVFRLAPDGAEKVLYAFTGERGGGEPYGGVVADSAGNLYGTTIAGGVDDDLSVVFKLSAKGKETVLHALDGANDGAWPETGVTLGSNGKLYGTAYAEGPDQWGTVFALKK